MFLYFAFSLRFFSLVVPNFLVFLASKGLGIQWCNVKRSCDMKIVIAIWGSSHQATTVLGLFTAPPNREDS